MPIGVGWGVTDLVDEVGTIPNIGIVGEGRGFNQDLCASLLEARWDEAEA